MVPISINDIAKIIRLAINNKLLNKQTDTATIFYDVDYIKSNIQTIIDSYPNNAMHTVAVKANPLSNILKEMIPLNFGTEVASLPELHHAIGLGFSPKKIIFDSPVKTINEIRFALKNGVYINVNCFEELKRIEQLITKSVTKSVIGLRINPQIGQGTIKATSVANRISKFGIPLDTNKEFIMNAFFKYKWLTGLHVHIGSQGMHPNLLIKGIKKVFELAEEVNQLFIATENETRIKFIDIGGGFPVKYHESDYRISLKDFSKKLKQEIPKLFTSNYKIITEYGRFIHANAGWAISRVEYIIKEKDYNIIITHLGADFMLRKAYNPNDWHHNISVIDKNGFQKPSNNTKKYKIAGPLCFAGDFIADDVILPKVEIGDYIVIHDVGSYTLSMWSKYNSRQVPKVISYTNENMEIVKERETLAKAIQFWK